MKIKTTIFLSLLFILGVAVKAQDTIVIGGDVPVDTSIVSTIKNNPDKVYKLKRGVRYYMNGVIESGDWHLKIIGETEPADLPPATLQPRVDEGANAPDYGIATEGDVTLKNLYFLNEPFGGREARGALNSKGSERRIEVDNCIFDYGFHIAIRNDGSLSSYFITNCLFKNIAFWANISNGKAFSIRQVDIGLDSIVIQNCTFSNMNNLMSGWGANVKFYKFDHNTAFNILKLPNEISQHCVEVEITNNIFYNVAVIGHAENPAPGGASWNNYYSDTDTTQLKSGWFRIQEDIRPDTIFAEDGTTAEYIFADQSRTINWTNNDVYFSDKLTSFWDTSSNYESQPFMNDTVAAWVANNDKYVVEDPLSIDPEFTILPNTIDSLILKVQQATDGTTPHTDIYYMKTDPNGAIQWPLELDFSFPTTSALYTASTEGGPIGDRRWFPNYVPVGVEEQIVGKLSGFDLSQNYPNPFNQWTTISYTLPKATNVNLTVFDISGKKVFTVVDKDRQESGRHNIDFNAQNLPAGVYYYRLAAGEFQGVCKMILFK